MAAVLAGLAVIFVLDRETGSAPVQHLYYLPIVLAGRRFRFTGGLAASVSAIVLYHLANPHLASFQYGHWDIVQVSLFVAAGLITARLTYDADRLAQLALTDDLTGLHNLRSFEARLAGLVAASRARESPLALLVLDVDRLKWLNDAHGHLAGAEAVRTVGQIIATHAPRDAVACRYGGDEFVIAIPDCTSARASAVADDLRRNVNVLAPVLAAVSFPPGTLSISVGVACCAFGVNSAFDDGSDPGEALFRAADAALYEAKAHGRNQVQVV
jgi:diguanylate cyclase (GGDEF)-like protein